MNTMTLGRTILAISALFILSLSGCERKNAPSAHPGMKTASNDSAHHPADEPKAASEHDPEHAHAPGAHGGIIVSLGRDSYHVEPVFDEDGTITLYMLQEDETRVLEVESQTLAGHAKSKSSPASIQFELQASPQSDDREGQTSRFTGKLPENLQGQHVDLVIPSIRIKGERFRLGFSSPESSHGDGDIAMPDKVEDAAERELYLTAGGIYTQADIEANGNQTASQKFAGFQSAHDMNPKPGDKICPITLTKATPKCAWIVNGHTYEFCCPPCVDEFVQMAKSQPEQILLPEEYVKK